VFHKPSREPYCLPFTSIHPLHMRKNIPFAMLLRAIRYCSTFQLFLNERESLRMALLLNKCPNELIDNKFNLVLEEFNINEQITIHNYNEIRTTINSFPNQIKLTIGYEKNLFIHFTYCSNMRTFPVRFHRLWKRYCDDSSINDI